MSLITVVFESSGAAGTRQSDENGKPLLADGESAFWRDTGISAFWVITERLGPICKHCGCNTELPTPGENDLLTGKGAE